MCARTLRCRQLLHSYNALAHRTFTFVRFLSDYAFNGEVRPNLIATETGRNSWPDSPLPPSLLRTSTEETDSELRSYGARILAQLYPEDHIAYISSTLPSGRVFDTAIDVELAPGPAREKKPFDEEKPGVIRYLRSGISDEAHALAAVVSRRLAARILPRRFELMRRAHFHKVGEDSKCSGNMVPQECA